MNDPTTRAATGHHRLNLGHPVIARLVVRVLRLFSRGKPTPPRTQLVRYEGVGWHGDWSKPALCRHCTLDEHWRHEESCERATASPLYIHVDPAHREKP